MGRYRSVPDPLAAADQARWFVVRDRTSRTVKYHELPPQTDLKATLAAERQRLIDDGWTAGPLTRYSSLFCERGTERWSIGIECAEPGKSLAGHGTFLGGKALNK